MTTSILIIIFFLSLFMFLAGCLLIVSGKTSLSVIRMTFINMVIIITMSIGAFLSSMPWKSLL